MILMIEMNKRNIIGTELRNGNPIRKTKAPYSIIIYNRICSEINKGSSIKK